MYQVIRYNWEWFRIEPKPYEPERQTAEIVWSILREPELKPSEAYRRWYLKERENAKVLYPSFRKENDRL